MRNIFGKYIPVMLRIIVFIIISFGTPGCKKEWLEAKTDKRQAVPTSVKDFQAMLDDFNSVNTSSLVLNEVAADGHYYTESFFTSMSSYAHLQNAYVWSAITPYETNYLYVYQYFPLYFSILDMNIISNEFKKSGDTDKAGLEQVMAQALFHRGRFYFELAQTFAPPYNAATADTDLGLPLRLSTDITEHSRRSSVKETYNQILSDLLAAKDILPEVPQFLTRASKPAALGMLAKVYLSMGDYSNAFKFADEYLDIKAALLDYSIIDTSSSVIGINEEVTFIKVLYPPASSLTSAYLISQDLYDNFHDDDLRKQIFFNVAPEGISFEGHYSNSQSEIFAGIATDEMYLIRAECYARAGDITAAMKDLNDLLRTRWAKNPDGSTKYEDQTAADETDALTRILLERKKQLILRNVRWTDLRRLNQEERFRVTLSRTIAGQTYELEPNSYKYTFPIPYEAIQKSGMPQNVGW